MLEKSAFVFLLALLALGTAVPVNGAEPPHPAPGDRCAVCGMYVAKHPNWVAAVVFADGSRSFFDGPKDLFRYLHNLGKYGAEDKVVGEVWVTDYYRVRLIDATAAYFVAGSDVMGPMGRELVPLTSREHAQSFARDHGGEAALTFDEITPDRVPR